MTEEAPARGASMDTGKIQSPSSQVLEQFDDAPSEEDMHTLRRVSGKINWAAYTIAFCELCERFSYYGSSILYTNFIQWPLPEGSNTGAGFEGQSGALGMGQRASTGLGLFNMFFAYVMPLLGAYIADAHLGRYKTIHVAIAISTIAHVILTAAAAPSVIVKSHSSFAAFIIGLLILCIGTGFFKANISPLLAEQNTDTRMRVEVRNGERVLVDPAVTNTRIFLYFYFAINIGSLTGQIAMVYVEKYVGFWLAFFLPTVLFLVSPIVLFFNRKRYILSPPTGSVLSKFFRMFGYVMRGKWTLNFAKLKREFSWDKARPSHVPLSERPPWMTYDDAWVDEVRRGLKACKVFLFLPLFHLAYNQMTNNLTSQAAVMELNGVPNDIIQNLNPISIIIMIPFMDHVLYPGLRKLGISFTPIKRMTLGFFFGALAMVAAAVMQYYIYKLSPCGNYAADPDCSGPAPINVWAQVVPYIFIGIAEIFTNVTSYEYAYSKAPVNMKSLVMSVNLFMSAFASAVGQAFTPLSGDPLLVWNYGVVAVLAFLGGVGFWFCFKKLDKEEDKWNTITKSEFQGKDFGSAARAEEAH
ncbi:POT family-domain-containing protein [Pseudomassariella vexata]|uniref:POT family-domain-containing protein n=1 Tax=Pseudomassariella vexata TaxID=1141098 RepID=A0A1Y2EII8_9PEZI|nr:POT family-domain-containing protein [Pseudomassariella vexata]ORY71399.1 POT family-domain-containing protein [Pseudomassariella vexata]